MYLCMYACVPSYFCQIFHQLVGMALAVFGKWVQLVKSHANGLLSHNPSSSASTDMVHSIAQYRDQD